MQIKFFNYIFNKVFIFIYFFNQILPSPALVNVVFTVMESYVLFNLYLCPRLVFGNTYLVLINRMCAKQYLN